MFTGSGRSDRIAVSLAGKIIFITSHVVLALLISFRFTGFVLIAGLLVFLALRRYLKKAEWLGNANITVSFNEQLEIRDLTFGYEAGDPLFIRFSATIPAHQITGIVGESGSGKTTLIDILAGLPGTGEPAVWVDGVPLTRENLRPYFDKIIRLSC